MPAAAQLRQSVAVSISSEPRADHSCFKTALSQPIRSAVAAAASCLPISLAGSLYKMRHLFTTHLQPQDQLAAASLALAVAVPSRSTARSSPRTRRKAALAL